MQFSVLMSVYCKENAQIFDRALRSNLIEQSRLPDQFVLICDGQLTSELEDVIRKYEAAFPDIMSVYRLEQNVGLGRALGYGVEKCRYELIARSDSDDVCVPNRFELQLEYMKNNPDIAAASGYIDEFDDDCNSPKAIKKMPACHDELCEYAKKRNPLNHMATIFRKKDIMEVGSYQHLWHLEDYYLWARVIAAGKKLGNLSTVLVHACVGNGMLERRGDRRYIKSYKTLGSFMLDRGLISRKDYTMSISRITIWCRMPSFLRSLIYKKLLRKSC